MTSNVWTSDWPTENGFYWFYGKCFKSSDKQDMFFVKVRKIVNGFCYVTNGRFIYEEEGAEGMWLPAEIPNPPTGEKDG